MLHILSELRPSGAEVMLNVASPFWFSAGDTHSILATGPAEGSYAAALRAAGFHVHHLPFRKQVAFFRQVIRILRSGHFDVLHIHTEQAHVFYALAARLAGVPRIIYTIHNVFPFEGALRRVRITMRWGLRLLGATGVAVGPSVAAHERTHLLNLTVIIPNWFNTRLFRRPSREEKQQARQSLGIPDGQPVVATLANCNPWKNHSLLLEALPKLVSDGRDWLYLHAGAEDPECTERRLAEKLAVAGHCRFLGPVSDARRILWAADVFVMPSIREGFSIAAIEAAACGLPLVLSDTPGLQDLKTVLADAAWTPLQPLALADAIRQLYLSCPFGSAQNAAAAHARYSVAAGARAYRNLYAGKPAFSSESPLR